MAPSVSVVMPVYNAERYLPAAVESILSQTVRDFEFIIIDDGSTDGSRRLLEECARRDARIRVVSRPNTGIVGALNDGLALCEGEFIARMDADDISLPERFEHQVSYLRQHRDCVMVGSRVLLIDPEGAPIRPWIDELSHEQIDRAHLSRAWPVVHPTVLIRRWALDAAGHYRKQYETLEDLDLFLRLAEVGKLANLPEILLHYRQHFASICHTNTPKQNSIRDNILAEAHARRGLAPLAVAAAAPLAKSRSDCHHLWAWWALNAGNISTARKHAMQTLARRPISADSWRLTYCALRGH
jgi:glycosyltransferase involved in cell wall biosynthesis